MVCEMLATPATACINNKNTSPQGWMWPCCRAPQVFVRCGLLRQLQTVLARCLGPQMHQFSVAVRKMLEITLKLPFTTDDIWHTRTAQGSFAAALAQLARLRVAHGRVAVSLSLRQWHSWWQHNLGSWHACLLSQPLLRCSSLPGCMAQLCHAFTCCTNANRVFGCNVASMHASM